MPNPMRPSERALVRPTMLGSLTGYVELDKPKARRAPRVAAKAPMSKEVRDLIAQTKKLMKESDALVGKAKTLVPAKKKARPIDRTKPDNFGYVLEKAVPKQCNAWTQTIDKRLGLVRFYVNAPRGRRFNSNGLHGAYRSAYALEDGTWDWVGTKNGFIDLRKIVDSGFYYCHDAKCDFQSCPQSYRGPRRPTGKKKSKPNRGEGMLFSPDGTGNKITWDDEGMMVIEPVTAEFHSFETIR